jgi:hypothetical protein
MAGIGFHWDPLASTREKRTRRSLVDADQASTGENPSAEAAKKAHGESDRGSRAEVTSPSPPTLIVRMSARLQS